jgi:8-oxo-dGTP pyrophosphatase MutT (NUDIX family)
MPRPSIPSWSFALVVARKGDRFLAVHERKHGGGWFLPAGRVEPGESFAQAACRETLEETGVPVELDGILRVEHTPWPDYIRVRVFFLAHPAQDVPPKSAPDEETAGAAWLTLAELEQFPLRDPEVLNVFRHVAAGGAVYPLSLMVPEATPWTPGEAAEGAKP